MREICDVLLLHKICIILFKIEKKTIRHCDYSCLQCNIIVLCNTLNHCTCVSLQTTNQSMRRPLCIIGTLGIVEPTDKESPVLIR